MLFYCKDKKIIKDKATEPDPLSVSAAVIIIGGIIFSWCLKSQKCENCVGFQPSLSSSVCFFVFLVPQRDVRAGVLCGRPSDEQPEAAGGAEEAEAGGGGHGGQQPEAGRGERGAAQPGQSVSCHPSLCVCVCVGMCSSCSRLTGVCVCAPPQRPAFGPEGEDPEGGGGGDEGHSELHRGRQSSRLRSQQARGQSVDP